MTARSCPPDCDQHPEHVYILCYGRPVHVSDRDYLSRETERDYPISHYVGYTRQRPPVRRIRSHGNRSAHYVAAIVPGTEADERRWKATGRCPKCGGSLWYYRVPPPDAGQRYREWLATHPDIRDEVESLAAAFSPDRSGDEPDPPPPQAG